MHLRKQMVLSIRAGEMNIAQASRHYGICKNTVRLWLRRAGEDSLENLAERSRRPKTMPRQTALSIEEQILEKKRLKPAWGAKKIVETVWPIKADRPVCVRTADRILERSGLVQTMQRHELAGRFERANSNELWQMDFKGMEKDCVYSPLSILDDATRFCLRFEPLENHQSKTIWDALWAAFAEFGLPDSILSDNESCFRDVKAIGPSKLEAKLWLLGIATLHGRPLHPQTQGKVERFHKTVKLELGLGLRQPSIEFAKQAYKAYVYEYNYERPHEAIGMKMPATAYTPSTKKRPDTIPKHEIPEGAIARRVDATSGSFHHKGHRYRAGKGLAGEYVIVAEDEMGFGVYYAKRRFADLEAILVS